VEAGLLDEAACEALDAKARAEVEAAVAFAEAGTPEPVEQLCWGVTLREVRR
jgi:pyruvate dehydrogenase E1 component alpha subunit